MTEEEQIAALGEAEAILLQKVLAKGRHTIATIVELTLHGGTLTLVHDVAVGVTDAGNTCHYTGAVMLAQTALDKRIIEGRAGDLIRGGGLLHQVAQQIFVLCGGDIVVLIEILHELHLYLAE
jgi:hypothetical protein